MKPASARKKDEKKSRAVLSDQASSPAGSMSTRKKPAFEDLHARISRRAYELYVQRGCRDGHALDDWLDAEREILDREFPA